MAMANGFASNEVIDLTLSSDEDETNPQAFRSWNQDLDAESDLLLRWNVRKTPQFSAVPSGLDRARETPFSSSPKERQERSGLLFNHDTYESRHQPRFNFVPTAPASSRATGTTSILQQSPAAQLEPVNSAFPSRQEDHLQSYKLPLATLRNSATIDPEAFSKSSTQIYKDPATTLKRGHDGLLKSNPPSPLLRISRAKSPESEPEQGSLAKVSINTSSSSQTSDPDPSNVSETSPEFVDLPSIAEIHSRFQIIPSHHFHAVKTSNRPVFSLEEDKMLLYLRHDLQLPWSEVAIYFPWRPTGNTLPSRYAKRLKPLQDLKQPREFYPHRADTKIEVLNRRREQPQRIARDKAQPLDFTDTGTIPRSSSASSSRTQSAEGRRISDLDPGSHDGSAKSAFRARVEHSQKNQYNKALIARFRAPLMLLSNRERLQLEKQRNYSGISGLMDFVHSPRILQQSAPGLKLQHQLRNQTSRKRFPKTKIYRPYLSADERLYLHQSSGASVWAGKECIDWNGQILHVNFTEQELESLEPAVIAILPPKHVKLPINIHARYRILLEGASKSQLQQISWRTQYDGSFLKRSRDSIENYLWDVATGSSAVSPSAMYLNLSTDTRETPTINSALRYRERLGLSRLSGQRISEKALKNQLKTAVYDTLGPLNSYTGTSGDVGTVSWSSDGRLFAVGSAALMDDASMQYNLPNNLLLGDAATATLQELPDHAVRRRTAVTGVNATIEMYLSQDPLLFTTISTVRFSPDSTLLFSAGYDNCTKIWDVSSGIGAARCLSSIPHKGRIDLLETNQLGLLATGANIVGRGSIQVIQHTDGFQTKTSLSSPLAMDRPESEIIPSCLRWGSTFADQQRYLICGFAPPDPRPVGSKDAEIVLWDVCRPEQALLVLPINNPFDIAWSSLQYGRFAIGALPGANCNRGTRSVVRIYDSRKLYSGNNAISSISVDKRAKIELECCAMDINDVIFSPFDDHMLSTSCTDGCTYVWDLRRPNELLHRFEHGAPQMALDESQPREMVDTGVRFVSCGESRNRLFTGSSDGVVKSWNPYLSPEDSHIRDIVTLKSGVMSGAFSPDFDKLLLGEVNGSITILSVGREDDLVTVANSMTLNSAEESKALLRSRLGCGANSVGAADKTGKEIAEQLIASNQIAIRPFGDLPIRQAVQGSEYCGPFDTSDDAPVRRAQAAAFQTRFEPRGDSCSLVHTIYKVTEEEQGDSRICERKIPGHIRRAATETLTKKEVQLECFRCQAVMLQADQDNLGLDEVRCYKCELSWRVDTLGFYELQTTPKPRRLNWWKFLDTGNDSDEDENRLDQFYHSQWQDRPPSPI